MRIILQVTMNCRLVTSSLRTALSAGLVLASLMAGAQPASSQGPSRQIVITIDDLPLQGQQLDADTTFDINRRITEVLARRQVPAIGFVNESKLERDGAIVPERLAALRLWVEAGLELGNHGYEHLDLHRVSVDEFKQDLRLGDAQTTRLLASAGRKPPAFFRHPFLHTGRSAQVRAQIDSFLESRGYRVAPVTIDNSEWIFSHAYRLSLEADDREQARKIVDAYIPYMAAKTAYYEGRAEALFDRDIPQTLLIHANALNADTLDALLTMYERRGYRFVSLDQALEDPAYGSKDTWTGAGGISWLDRWALVKGKTGDFFAEEPTCPQWIQELAGLRE